MKKTQRSVQNFSFCFSRSNFHVAIRRLANLTAGWSGLTNWLSTHTGFPWHHRTSHKSTLSQDTFWCTSVRWAGHDWARLPDKHSRSL